MEEDSWTSLKILQWSTKYLESVSGTPRVDAEMLIGHALGWSRVELYTRYQNPLSIEQRGKVRDLIKRRKQGEPCAYLMGEADFFGRRFKVDASTLIPRFDSEKLVEEALAALLKLEGSSHVGSPLRSGATRQDIEKSQNPLSFRDPSDSDKPIYVLDLGTGTGCLGLTVLLEYELKRKKDPRLKRPLHVTLLDKEEKCVRVARENAVRFNVQSFQALCRDMEDPWPAPPEGAYWDLILSNPPYVSQNDLKSGLLERSVFEYEPHQALFGGEDGLKFYEIIATKAQGMLHPEGTLIVEMGFQQKEDVLRILQNSGWTWNAPYFDLEGRPRGMVSRLRVDKATAQESLVYEGFEKKSLAHLASEAGPEGTSQVAVDLIYEELKEEPELAKLMQSYADESADKHPNA